MTDQYLTEGDLAAIERQELVNDEPSILTLDEKLKISVLIRHNRKRFNHCLDEMIDDMRNPDVAERYAQGFAIGQRILAGGGL